MAHEKAICEGLAVHPPLHQGETASGIRSVHLRLSYFIIRNPSWEVVFEMNNCEVPSQWSQIATVYPGPEILFVRQGFLKPDGSLGRESSVKPGLLTGWPIAGGYGASGMDISLPKRRTDIL